MTLSVIIPVVNEERALERLLPFLNSLEIRPNEIIVVDSNSDDKTKEVAQKNGVYYLNTNNSGRASQQHVGALAAKHEVLCFLHADTFPNENFLEQIDRTLKNDRIALAGFVSVMKGKKSRWLISFLNYTKTYFCPLFYRPHAFLFKGLRLLFGDQVMFCRRQDYLKVGGFDPNVEIMEEADLCLKMNRLGRIKQIHHKVYSSDRRVARLGLWKALRIYIYVAIGWVVGVPTKKLKAKYADIR